ncbi:DUF4386 domain-containing protein [Nonomuraea sp. NPDC050383]|uniref:DUF4386 domain-containing protein n=1 Tax=Nonomuraea sp. NPDC050383 TaxID=3364362 RepID=UPI00379D1269
MSSTRKAALVAGVFFVLTEITGIAALALYAPVVNAPDYVIGPGADTRVLLGALSEVILVIAVIGTGVTLFPILKAQNEAVALGYVCGRLMEAAAIAVGIVSVLSVVTLRQDLAGAADTDTASLVTVGRSLVALHDGTFLFGPNIALGVNTLLLAYLMYRSARVPRPIAVLGLAGGPIIFASATAVMFGLYEQVSVWGVIAAVPVFAWEVALAVWLIAKGFRPAPGANALVPSS